MTDQSPPFIAICCCTFKRPEGIEKLLKHLDPAVEFLNGQALVKTIVIDNDADGSAQETVEFFAKQAHHPVIYQIESKPGIPAARNASVQWAIDQGADFMAFIDDDEYPPENWLALMLSYLLEHTDVSVVNGPVVPNFPDNTPKWMKSSRVFIRIATDTGTQLNTCATNNTLAKKEVFAQVPDWFDDAFRFTGGSDTNFFSRVAMKDMLIHRYTAPFVTEDVPRSRLNWKWIATRYVRLSSGNSSRRIKLKQTSQFTCLAIGLVKVGLGILRLLCIFGWLPQYRERSIYHLFGGYGRIIGTFDHNVEQYKVEN